MRILEIGLIAINFGLLYWAFIANRKSGQGIVMPLTIAAGLVIVQFAIEGGRWQMIPAYMTPVVLTAYFFLGKRKEGGKSRVKVTFQAAILTVYLLVSIALPAVMPVFSFEKPTGPYPVGTTVYHWVDELREETYTADPDDRRELMVQIWYPAANGGGKKQSPYVQNASKATGAIASKMMNLPAFALSHLGLVKTHSMPEADLSDSESRYPVLIFSHGMNGYRNQNMFQVEELASHGYIVLGIDYAFEAAVTVYPDGRAALSKTDPGLTSMAQYDEHIPLWVGDAEFVLNQVENLNRNDSTGRFTGKLDVERIGMLGHSFGGTVTTQVLATDSRVKAALSMDGGFNGFPLPPQGPGKPYFLMYSAETYNKVMVSFDEVATKVGNVSREEFEAPRKTYIQRSGNALAGGGLSILIPGSKHASYTDLALFSPWLWLGGVDPRRDHHIVNEFSIAFFDRYLKGKNDAALQELAAKYPEVNFKVNK